jgi:transcriptional regulator with XRE-family HTH domain
MSNIGENIKRYRDLRQYSQEYMASKLNITQSSYAKLEKQDTKLTVDRLQQIAETLDVDVSLLLNSATPTIFNLYDNQTANGRVEHLYNNLPEQLISQYQNQIQQLKEEVAFLRGLVGKK